MRRIKSTKQAVSLIIEHVRKTPNSCLG
jgi:hypothetical protein